ncbi:MULTISPECIES: hypothetical protein [unclassified Bradyrhizobium]|uniref:hypothetical protein n=1 Tax=unclassified Bradyrhizobium TaxID=2631580 RepID=UPI002305C876|nr:MULTISPECIES: hypothetical protein [unclassified Bradyrhizobium]MDA9406513.1 hypothetical protein [Bradyrhizobium sp. CCBAU 45384]MDA9444038.1 hypothetical protein [Bradyrhizobium sp. CCBAU 51745]
MGSYTTKVDHEVGGDRLTVDLGGSINFNGVTFSVSAAGKLIVSALPTADPHVVGALWANSGVLTVSAG